MNSCTECFCYNGESWYDCHYIKIRRRNSNYQLLPLLNTKIYVYTNAADILVQTSSTAVINFNITYRGEWVDLSVNLTLYILPCLKVPIWAKILMQKFINGSIFYIFIKCWYKTTKLLVIKMTIVKVKTGHSNTYIIITYQKIFRKKIKCACSL